MKKTTSILFLLLFAIILLPVAEAQKPVARQVALNNLIKTNRAIGFAHMAVKRGKVYTGNLGKAVRNQRYAKKLFLAGKHLKAIHYSRRARVLALEAVKANKVKPNSDFNFTAEENESAANTPTDQELEDELNKEMPGEIKDEELIQNNNLDLDVK